MDGSSDGERWRWRVMVINNGKSGRAGEDGGESSEIFDFCVEPGSTIPETCLEAVARPLYFNSAPFTVST